MSQLPESSKFEAFESTSSITSAPVSDLTIKLENADLDTLRQRETETTFSSHELSHPKFDHPVEKFEGMDDPEQAFPILVPFKTHDEIRTMSRTALNEFATNQQNLVCAKQHVQQKIIQQQQQLIQSQSRTIEQQFRSIEQLSGRIRHLETGPVTFNQQNQSQSNQPQNSNCHYLSQVSSDTE